MKKTLPFLITFIHIAFSTTLVASHETEPFDFIASKHPECISLSQQDYREICLDEYRETIKDPQIPQLLINALNLPLYDPALFEDPLECGLMPLMERELYLKSKLTKRFKHPFFKVQEHAKLDDRTTVGFDIFLTSLQLDYQLRLLSKEPEHTCGVIFLGRTPYLYRLFLEEIQKKHPHRYNALQDEGYDLIHLAYSGHPDALSRRPDPVLKDSDIVRTANLVTEERLDHYLNYMESKQIHKYNRIIIVDIMSTGSGMSRFLTLLKAFYRKMEQPYRNPLFMQLTDTPGFWLSPPTVLYTRDECIYRFLEDKTNNYDKHILPFIQIPAKRSALGSILDNDFNQFAFFDGIYYPAQRWSPQYDAQRDAGGPLKEAVKNLMVPLIQRYINEYNNRLQLIPS